MKHTIETRLDLLTGQLAALELMVRALLITHPSKDAADARFHDEFEQAFSRVLPRAFPEGFVDGLQQTRAKLLKD